MSPCVRERRGLMDEEDDLRLRVGEGVGNGIINFRRGPARRGEVEAAKLFTFRTDACESIPYPASPGLRQVCTNQCNGQR